MAPNVNLRLTLPAEIKATNGSGYNTSRAGAKPHGQKDKVLLPKKLISALPMSNQEPTLSARIVSGPRRLATKKLNFL